MSSHLTDSSVFETHLECLEQALGFTNHIIKNTPYAFCLFDDHLQINFWSCTLADLSGIQNDRAKGSQVDIFLPFLKNEITKLRACLDGKQSSTINIPYEFENSKIRSFYDIHYIPIILSSQDSAKGLILIKDLSTDVLIQNKLLESEDRFKNLADAAPVFLWLAQEDGSCTYFNQSWLDFTGKTLDQEKGFGWAEGIHPDDLPRCLRSIANDFENRKYFETEYRLKNRYGEYRWMMARGIPRYNGDGKFSGFTGSCIDITDHKILVTELQAAKVAADTASVIKTQFLANVSHEIRTPLGIIIGFADILRNEQISADERNGLLDRILKSGNQLLHIIDDVLDVSKVEANKFEIELIDFSIKDLINEIKELFEFRAQEKGLIFKTIISENMPDYVKSDPTRMKQILINIIGNSIKFTSEGFVELKIESYQIGPKFCLGFTVTDTGLGIRDDYQNRIFKPFSQVDSSTTRKYGGTGLGLHLSRKLAQMLNGNLELVTSKLYQGSTFFFHLPVLVVDSKETAVHFPSQAELQKKFNNLKGIRILVADDAEENRILIEKYLMPYGLVLKFAQNGLEAVEMASRNDFDLILMDIQMPELDGYGALTQIREFNSDIPIIALTAHALKTEKDKCLAIGFCEHVTKPVNKQKLVSTISALTKKWPN